MFSRRNSSIIEDRDIGTDINELAQTLEDVLNSWGDEASDEAKHIRKRAASLLKDSRARLNGNSLTGQRARDAASYACSWMQERPLYSAGIVAVAGIVLGALLVSRR